MATLSNNGPQPVAITQVDVATRRARGITRQRSEVEIDVRYHVGGLQITPAVGEQWFVSRQNGFYYQLVAKIPDNAPEMLTEAVEGQVQVGSSGPLELRGTHVNLYGPVQLAAYTTAERPAAAAFAAGAMIYDVSLGKPLFSNGAVWKDAAGTSV